MLLTPINYFVSLQLVPVFQWERVDAPDGAAPPAPCVGTVLPGEGSVEPPSTSDAPSSDMRLVFKGYEWRPVAERTVFAREDWESVYRSEADAKEEDRDPHSAEATRRPTVPPPKPTHDPFEGMHTNPSVDRPDTTES
ncbi:MAG TPA: hypothetical protein VFU71_09520 [Burkholderiaceae bacterium]|nr:hypothetical protein [Burkholderiaceae bacterium]